MNKSFLIGSDPEVFLRREGNLMPAFNFIEGDKHHPQPTPNGSIQYDNIMAEFNSKPSASLEEFILNHELILSDLSNFLLPDNLLIDITPAVICGDELLSDSRTWVMGCEPDYNAWTGKVNPRVQGEFNNLRVAGGHLHISTEVEETEIDEDFRIRLVKSLDFVLGVQSVVHDPSPESRLRKTQYGKAGSFRPKFSGRDAYDGVEYRTLSNYWLKSKTFLTDVYLGVDKVINNLDQISPLANLNKSLINKIINNNDLKLAEKFINKHHQVFNFSNYNFV